jgi:hypothetical protein
MRLLRNSEGSNMTAMEPSRLSSQYGSSAREKGDVPIDLIELIVIERTRVRLRELSWANGIELRNGPGTTGGLERARGWHEGRIYCPRLGRLRGARKTAISPVCEESGACSISG